MRSADCLIKIALSLHHCAVCTRAGTRYLNTAGSNCFSIPNPKVRVLGQPVVLANPKGNVDWFFVSTDHFASDTSVFCGSRILCGLVPDLTHNWDLFDTRCPTRTCLFVPIPALVFTSCTILLSMVLYRVEGNLGNKSLIKNVCHHE